MKRYFVLVIFVLVALISVWSAFGQAEGNERKRNQQVSEGQKETQGLTAEEKAKLLEQKQNVYKEEKQKSKAQMREPTTSISSTLGREEQLKVIEDIERRLAKLKAAVKEGPNREDFRKLSEASLEQQAKLRKEWQKSRKQQQQLVNTIQEQLAKFTETRPQTVRTELLMNELKVIHQTAIKENAKKTAQYMERLIARLQKGPEDQPIKSDKLSTETNEQQTTTKKKFDNAAPTNKEP